MRTWRDVIGGPARWSCEAADAVAFVAGLPDDSVDLLFCSPPYLHARTYGIGAGRDLDEWVAWMVSLVRAAAPKVRGLIAINCEGQTHDFRYLPAPYLLLTALHNDGHNIRKPPIYHRSGIPGSGGPDWLRNDYEPVICVTRPGRLPWSDPTACGEPPRYKPGGAMSHRTKDGTRVGIKMNRTSGYGTNGDLRTVPGVYVPPEIANPGNVISLGKVGGGHMGHPLAHENEAPFPLALAAFFVKSFAPPGGIVLDCFCGSGTVIHAAFENGRRAIGCDVRPSQVALTHRRLATVTPNLF